jgi:hypothetical protein
LGVVIKVVNPEMYLKDKTININENTKATGEKINRDILENQKLSKEIKNNLQVEHRIKSQEIPKANAESKTI